MSDHPSRVLVRDGGPWRASSARIFIDLGFQCSIFLETVPFGDDGFTAFLLVFPDDLFFPVFLLSCVPLLCLLSLRCATLALSWRLCPSSSLGPLPVAYVFHLFDAEFIALLVPVLLLLLPVPAAACSSVAVV